MASRAPSQEANHLVKHGASRLKRLLSKVPLSKIDKRTRVGAMLHEAAQELLDHVGADVTAPQRRLIEDAAVLVVIRSALSAWLLAKELKAEEGGMPGGGMFRLQAGQYTLDPALDGYLRTAERLHAVLVRLGLERRQKPVETLEQLVARIDREKAEGA